MAVEPDVLPIETNLQNICAVVGEIMALGRKLSDPACEMLLADTCSRILKTYRSDKAIEIVLMERIYAGSRSISELAAGTRLARRRIAKILERLAASGRVETRNILPPGSAGGRPKLAYWLTKNGENYYVDARKRYESLQID